MIARTYRDFQLYEDYLNMIKVNPVCKAVYKALVHKYDVDVSMVSRIVCHEAVLYHARKAAPGPHFDMWASRHGVEDAVINRVLRVYNNIVKNPEPSRPRFPTVEQVMETVSLPELKFRYQHATATLVKYRQLWELYDGGDRG